MPLAIALIVGVVLLAAVLFGILWALLFLVPYYVYAGAAAYLVWRARRRGSDLQTSVRHQADQQRLLNEQEARAWQVALGTDQADAAERLEALRNRRDPQKE